MKRETITVWITKYAVSRGIHKVEAEVCWTSPNTITYKEGDSWPQFARGRDWHRTREEAIARGKEMLAIKIESVKKQLRRLESMEITASE